MDDLRILQNMRFAWWLLWSWCSQLLAIQAQGKDVVDPLSQWIRANGGRVDVRQADPANPAKGVVAAATTAEGELFAVIPFSTCLQLPGEGSAQEVAAAMLKQSADPADWYRPMWDSGMVIEGMLLPAGVYSFPPEYLPLLAAPELEEYVLRLQGINKKFWEEHSSELEPLASYEHFSKFVHIVGTKSFHYIDSTYVIPLVDLATHQFRCTHYASITGCSASTKPPDQQQQQQQQQGQTQASTSAAQGAAAPTDIGSAGSSSNSAGKSSIEGLCVAWFAGNSVAAGEELCSTFGVSFSDEALLLFGVVMAADIFAGSDLAAVDTRLFNPKQPFKYQEEGILEELEGDQDALLAEKKRLLSRIQLLDASKATVAAAEPLPGDEDGRLLAAVRAWRGERLAALIAESARVDQAIALMWSGYDDEDDWEPAEPPAIVSIGSKRERLAASPPKVEL